LTHAKAEKEKADRILIEEKANTERVQQEVLLAGIDFDKQKLRIERTQTLADVDAKLRGANGGDQVQEGKPYVKKSQSKNMEERGLKSNNKTEEQT